MTATVSRPRPLSLDALSNVLSDEFSFERPLTIGAKWLYCGLAHHGLVGDEARDLVLFATRGRLLTPSMACDGRAHFLINWFALDELRVQLDGWKRCLPVADTDAGSGRLDATSGVHG